MHLFCQIIINSLGLGVSLGGNLIVTKLSLRLAYNVSQACTVRLKPLSAETCLTKLNVYWTFAK